MTQTELWDAAKVSLWPRPGVSGATLLTVLRQVHSAALNIHAGTNGTSELISSYLRWASKAQGQLRLVMRPHDIDRLVLTSRYWATLANPAPSAAVVAAVNDEIMARQRDLDGAIHDLQQQLDRWKPHTGAETYMVVPDTNVLLHHPQMLTTIDWRDVIGRPNLVMDYVRVVLPLLVIDELDDAKHDKVRSRARQTLKAIYTHLGSAPAVRYALQAAGPMVGEVTMEILLDDPEHVRLGRTDDELVDRAVALQGLTGLLVDFVTFDTGAALRARAAGLRAHRLEHTQ